MAGSQTYKFYSDFNNQYDFPEIVESNFNTRDKFWMSYAQYSFKDGYTTSEHLNIRQMLDCKGTNVIWLYYSAIDIIYSIPECGDGLLSPGEECDDGNIWNSDGCSKYCKVHCGWKCPFANWKCVKETCGNGDLDIGENCDDGNNSDGDGCPYDCKY